mmetsp:Transcript_5476/g.4662  ORF Transcript_5476/g.4662 Transcript_5476/m.4662 type:complete len:99 (+) Transcript_5476:535-831(+)
MYVEFSATLGIKIMCVDKYYCPTNPIHQAILTGDQIDALKLFSVNLKSQAHPSSYSFFDSGFQDTTSTIDFDYISKSVSRKIGGGEYKHSSLRSINGY